MPTGEKNQVMICINALPTTDRLIKWPGCFLSGLILAAFLWGCAVAPTKKLQVEDIAESFEEGTIISARLGEPVSIGGLIEDLDSCRITYVGEKHTNIAHHKIQLQIIQAVYRNSPSMAVGMEMFDHTYQDVLDLWSKGELTQKDFLRKSHWYANWRYDFSLYRDILEFIKEHNIRLVGLNIPNHIPPKIREGGIENLSHEDKAHLPQQIDTSKSAHREYLKKVFEGHKHHFKREVEFEDFYAAQSVWEDAMAERIAKSLNDDVMVVLAGNGHIQFKYGIPERAYKQTGASFRTIYLEPVGSEVKRDIADYIWVTQ
ncbi:hypothetical protein D1BOALGB6SA_6785 [Olavius sp. associated proteobacterium Delta 1]|nr:hypothetical protein D1BOALGB6SA_6785 [Olavius sp. associated proteobacterium Delta 1]